MSRLNVQRAETDVLVIGGGIAGLMAALEAAKYAPSVTLIDKLIPGRSGSSPTSGGAFAVYLGDGGTYDGVGPARSGDSVEALIEDTYAGGDWLNSPEITETWPREIASVLLELEELGVRFAKSQDGRFFQYQPMGHRFPRVVSPLKGSVHLLGVLRREVLGRNVRCVANTTVLGLLKSGGAVAGALTIDNKTQRLTAWRAGSTVLAAGSCIGMMKYASASYRTTGDGYWLAYQAGAPLANMEFMEFTVIPKVRNYVISSSGISPFVGKGALIVNASGERFLQRYDPARMERTTRAILARAVYAEIAAGRGPVWNDATHFPEEVWTNFEATQDILVKLRSVGLDYRRERFEWVPAVHTFLGGTIIDRDGATQVDRLFAVGEAATGVHGSNRVASNAIAAFLVLGKRAGKAAARLSQRQEGPGELTARSIRRAYEAALGDISTQGGESPTEIESRLCEGTWKGVGVVRSREGALRLLDQLAGLAAAPLGPQEGLLRAFEVRNELFTAGLVARSVLLREESRGQHYREDFPDLDPGLQHWIVWRAGTRDAQYVRPGGRQALAG